MSLVKPHHIWTSCGSNPYECHKAVTTVRMLSGRYQTDKLQRHWTQNRSGSCLLPVCEPCGSEGSLEHLLLFCTALECTRQKLFLLLTSITYQCTEIHQILQHCLVFDKPTLLLQLLLDCASIPEVIKVT